MRYLALLLLLAPWPAICQMNTGCPWLNVATATGVLRSTGEFADGYVSPRVASRPADFTYHDQLRLAS